MPPPDFSLFPDDVRGGGPLKNLLWRLGSNATLFSVGVLCKLWMQTLNTTDLHNYDNWVRAVADREKGKPLLTICNHTSNVDDPLLFGLLPLRLAVSPSSLRWSLGADNVCFSKPSHATFCALAKVIPVRRGDGVYQRGVDAVLERMNAGEWAHIFPEGKVNMNQEWMRLKWGMGRLVAEARLPPLVLPFWHEGLTDVLPHRLPYRPRTGQRVTVVFGDAVDATQLLAEARRTHGDDARGVRKAVTDHFQAELRLLKDKTRTLHFGAVDAALERPSVNNDNDDAADNVNVSNSTVNDAADNVNVSNSAVDDEAEELERARTTPPPPPPPSEKGSKRKCSKN